MPIDHHHSILQPGSPLSPKMETLSLPTQSRLRQQRQHLASGPLRLPSLPRFHPANFPSQNTSAANTPSSGLNSPQPPVSPRSQQRQYSDAQRQLYAYQRELVATASRASKMPPGIKPVSPRLIPLAGSPGPVTPLELEGQTGGYMMAGAGSPGRADAAQAEYVEETIREEALRRGSPQRPASGGRY